MTPPEAPAPRPPARQPLSWVSWVSWVLLVAALALAGCGAAAPRPLTQEDAAAAWSAPVLGASPDVVLVVRLRAIAQDPIWGRIFSGTSREKARDIGADDPATDAAMSSAAELELLGRKVGGGKDDVDAILILRGVSESADPRSPANAGRTAWKTIGPAPSGAVAFVRSDKQSDLRLYVLPQGTWVFAVGPSSERVGAALARESRLPRSDAEPRALAYAYVEGPALSSSSSSRPRSPEEARAVENLRGVGISLDPVTRGQEVTATFRLVYGSSGDASSAEDVLRGSLSPQQMQSQGLGHLAGPMAALLGALFDISRDGRVVTVRLRLPYELLARAK